MLNNEELKAVIDIRLALLHYWSKFPEGDADKKKLNYYQNTLDTIIANERKNFEHRQRLFLEDGGNPNACLSS